ncbi:MAG TPA: alpha/beta fold hydrolase [Solirubrobacteraceae bacterium]
MAADPLWGVGCGWAFQSGAWLAEELGGVLGAADASNAEIDQSLERYRRRHRRGLLGHHLLTSDYSSGRRFSPIERLLFAAAAKDERSAAAFNALGARCIAPNGGEFARLCARTLRVNALHPRRATADPPTGAHAAGGPAPAGVRQSRLRVDGPSVPLSSAGAADGDEAVVFVHGNPGSRRDWDDMLARVAPFARGLAWDMPGFGHADKPRDFDYTVAGYARFLGHALTSSASCRWPLASARRSRARGSRCYPTAGTGRRRRPGRRRAAGRAVPERDGGRRPRR